MSKIKVHIRGKMGVQVIQAFVGLSTVNDGEEPLIVVNTGGNLAYDSSSKVQLLFHPFVDIIEQDEIRKTPYWLPGATSRAFKTRKRTLSLWLKPKALDYHTIDCLIHLRGGDKRSMSEDAMKLIVDRAIETHGSAHVCTDDVMMVRSLGFDHRVSVSPQDSVHDWATILAAKNVYCAPSAFVLSTLLVNPTKRVVVGPIDGCDQSVIAGDVAFIEEARDFCKNLELI